MRVSFGLSCAKWRRVWLAIAIVAIAVGISSSRSTAFTTVPLSPDATPGAEDARGEVTVELPPPDLPTSNEQGYTYDLESSLNADLDAVAREAAVYELRRPDVSQAEAQQIADRLQIGADATDRGDGTFEASGNGQLYVSKELVQFFSAAEAPNDPLPEDQQAIDFARDWLRVAGLLPPDLGDGRIVSRVEETKRVTVLFGPAEPAAVLAAYPSIAVTVGPNGTVLEASLRWANVVRIDVYQLMPARQAWQLIESGQAYLEAELQDAGVAPGSDIKGRATFDAVRIAYSTSGPPGGSQYLQPIYVFEGTVRVDDVEGSYPVRAYIPALSNSGAPVGQIDVQVVA
jgi:hypothetical protein